MLRLEERDLTQRCSQAVTELGLPEVKRGIVCMSDGGAIVDCSEDE